MTKREMPHSVDFEIINIEPMNKYISECEIKVFYHGRNRNGSYISKAVGNQIANSLPRAPIVALYDEQVDDYVDHGEEITINRDGIKFEKKTIPYGAVDQHTPAVWKKFWDNGVEREYLVVRGFLWTGRYPHLEKVLEKPKGQSMEFFEESVDGNWAKFDNEEDEIFIFNEADISALCILGDDVEPCFESASIGKPEIMYSLEKNEFKKEFDIFMFELNEALEYDNSTKGGMAVDKDIKKDEVKIETEFSTEAKTAVKKAEDSKLKEDVSTARDLVNKMEDGEEKDALKARLDKVEVKGEEKEEFDLEGKEEKVELPEDTKVEDPVDYEEVVAEKDSEIAELTTNYTLVKKELEDLKVEFAALKEEKDAIDLAEKESVCNKFSILGEEVLKSFRENLNNYTAEELEKELSVIAFQKGVSFNLLTQKDVVVTPNVNKSMDKVPAWVKAVEKQEENNY